MKQYGRSRAHDLVNEARVHKPLTQAEIDRKRTEYFNSKQKEKKK